ncbi:hypothetical protein T310_6904 [Rasamsonia emersonii CBS 393.64]|uniref:Uncharacterized protein n=1 Tax=Rasamsonia emersonii (strain ATCC 16479 / CBS 393.64 / IMI 116815) TaxID=1408163 RepID=A0A0F4YM19_RASE3|nr:hypothetical protein T310_6904 [Rasamsonia emersonii CBS 393.64]KKA19140.1 hypothetical protein T310_6904 [Rasamsonia emersonii CBS 393.64]
MVAINEDALQTKYLGEELELHFHVPQRHAEPQLAGLKAATEEAVRIWKTKVEPNHSSRATVAQRSPHSPAIGRQGARRFLLGRIIDDVWTNQPRDDNDNDKRIPPIRTVWEKSFPLGVSLVLSQGAGSLIGGIAGYLLSRRKDNTKAAAGWLYVAGTVFSMAHFVLVPWIIAAIRPIVEPDSPEGKKAARNGNRDNLRQWLRVHAVRTLVSDIPAFLSFLGATAAYFS